MLKFTWERKELRQKSTVYLEKDKTIDNQCFGNPCMFRLRPFAIIFKLLIMTDTIPVSLEV